MAKVVHFEIPVDDRERATAFYASVFDWDIQHLPEMQYTMVGTVAVDENQLPTEPGAINGGLMERSTATPSPVITIDVDEIDDALKKVEAEGGSVVTPKTPIPGMGAFAYFKDSEGNTMGLFQTH
ncbi:MAG TPA: VOC family protein [Actinomycetota bacterium]|nr:VOC family protein [Actinomycetota bacterium]